MITVKRVNDERVKVYIQVTDEITITKILNDTDIKKLHSDLSFLISRKMIPISDEG